MLKSCLKVSFFFFFTCVEAGKSYAQTNLIPNWSFEEYNSCPNINTGDCQINYLSIPALKDWYCAMTYRSTADYYNNCGIFPSGDNNWKGFQLAHTGYGYSGGAMHPFYNPFNIEYIQCKLNDSLKSNITYCVQYYINRADKSDYLISQHGAVFTHTQLAVPSTSIPIYINLTPQVKNPIGNWIKDSINWTKIEGTFIANGGEHYLTLGSFGIQSLTDTLYDKLATDYYQNYIYIDDVSVEEVLNAQAGTNKTINCGDTTVIGADSAIGASYKWFPSAGLNYDTLAFPMATPTITTKYVVQKTQCKIITYDTVIVNVTNTCPYINYQDEFIIPNVFTPNGDNVNDVWSFNLGFGNTLKGLYVYNRWGNIEHVTSSIDNVSFIKWDGRTTSGIECSSGIYFYVLEYTNILGEQKKVNGYISLIK